MIENLANVETEEEAVLVIATHGGTARAIIGSYLELPVSKWTTLGGLSNASWSVLEPRKFPKILETDPKVDLTVFHRNQWQLVEHNALTIPEPVIGDDDAE
jgi:probable phosphoglycerate mutase